MKAVSIYKLNDLDILSKIKQQDAQDDFAMFRFTSCGLMDTEKRGFVETNIDGQYISRFDKFTVLQICTQTKKPAKQLVKDLTSQKIASFLEANPAVPEVGGKTLKIFKEEARDEALQLAYPDEPKYFYVVFTDDGLVYVEGKQKLADTLLSLVRKVLGSLPVVPLETDIPVTDFLDDCIKETDKLYKNTKFVLGEAYTVVDDNGAKGGDSKLPVTESKALEYLEDGYYMNTLAMNHDGVVSFTLDADMNLSGVKYDECLTQEAGEDGSDAAMTILRIKAVDDCIKELVINLTEDKE